MKKAPCTFFFFFFLAIHTFYAQGTWEKLTIPATRLLKSVYFTDSLYGWVAGDSGTVFHTSDGGETWILQNTGTTDDIVCVFFLDRNRGWASSLNYRVAPFGTIFLKTTDGGDTWIKYPFPRENVFINCILFSDSVNGWIGGSPHAIAKTTNGGTDWIEAETDTTIFSFFPVLKIFFKGQYGYACGGMFDIAGVIWRTSNGGDKWYTIDPSDAPADEVRGLHIFDSVNVIGAGGDPDYGYGVGIMRTSDGGINWDYEELGIQGTSYDLDFRTATEAWAPLGPVRKFIFSADAGTSWSLVPTPDSTVIYDVIFPDSLHGYAVGAKGAVIRYIPSVIPLVEPTSAAISDIILCQNMPNPFEEKTTIRFQIPAFSRAELQVFDVFGNMASSLVTDELSSGIHTMNFNANGLQKGIYIYRLKVIKPDNGFVFSEIKKMVVIR